MRAFVAKYFVEANYFYLQFLLVDFVLLSALPVMGTEYEMSQDFVPLHALVLTRDFKLFDNIPIDECCQGSTFLQYLCAVGLVSCGEVMKLSQNDATAIFAYGYNEAQRLDDDGIHVNDDDIHHHEESLPLHRVLHALLDTKSHSPDHSYEICVILAGMIKCGCDPHLPNVRMETALQLSAKVDGVVFSYMIRREIVSELKSTTHSAIIGEIADQVKQGFFGEEVEVSPRRGKSDKEIVNDEGKAEQDSAATTEGSGDFVSRAEFDKLKTDIKASRR